MEIIQVSATSPTSSVAQAIGAEAVHRAEQALTWATGYLKHEGICVDCVPEDKEALITSP